MPANAQTLVYTVPTGYVLLFKSAIFTAATAGTSSVVVQLADSTGADLANLEMGSVSPGAGQLWQGWTALNATDRLFVSPGSIAVYYWLSGALLPFAPGL